MRDVEGDDPAPDDPQMSYEAFKARYSYDDPHPRDHFALVEMIGRLYVHNVTATMTKLAVPAIALSRVFERPNSPYSSCKLILI